MSTPAPTFRGLAAVVAVLVGLTWGAPLAQAACVSLEHCGDAMPVEHCQWDESSPSTGCLMHLAGQEAVPTNPLLGSVPTAGEIFGTGTPSISLPRASRFRRSQVRRAFVRVEHRHAHVGVWLE